MIPIPFSFSRSMLLAGMVAASWTANAQDFDRLLVNFDLVFRGGQVMDGSGTPAVKADVGIKDGVITAVGDLSQATAKREIDVTGKTIFPGIIDLHSHADEGAATTGGLRSKNDKRRAAPNLVAQGVTTVVVNMDGRSPGDILQQKTQLEERKFGPNAILTVGHNTVRQAVMKNDHERAATPAEIDAMRALVRRGMEDGAWGLSAGLEYVPGIWSTTEEVTALVKEVAPYRGVYIVHERSSGSDPMWYVPSRDKDKPITTMLDSIKETIAIAEVTGVVSVATHIKARGEDYWGTSAEMIRAIQEARDRGVKIFADQYPYNTSGSDGSIALLPRWIEEDARTASDGATLDHAKVLADVLRDPLKAQAIRRDVLHQISRRGGAENIVVFQHPNKEFIGKSLAELAKQAGVDPLEMAYRLQADGFKDRFGGAQLRGYSLSEEDIERFAAQPWVATASDAGIALPEDGSIHARYYGTFPRKIRHYAIERGVLSVEQAVRSMTSLPAEILGVDKRGLVKEGFWADLAVIDLATIRDTATFFEPHQYPEGVDYVLVNGKFVVEAGELTYALPGRVLTPQESMTPLDTD